MQLFIAYTRVKIQFRRKEASLLTKKVAIAGFKEAWGVWDKCRKPILAYLERTKR